MRKILQTMIDYPIQQRRKERRTTRLICVVAAIALSLYIASSSFYLSGADLKIVVGGCVIFLCLDVFYFYIITTGFYLRNSWIDASVIFFAFLLQTVIAHSYSHFTVIIGLSWPVLIIINTSTLMFAASICIVAAPLMSLVCISAMTISSAYLLFDYTKSLWALMAYAMGLGTAAVVSIFTSILLDTSRRRAHEAMAALYVSKKTIENLLYGVLPKDVADRLKKNDSVADAFSEVSVIFIDIVGFTQLTRGRAPKHILEILNRFFKIIDDCAHSNHVVRIKTIGDAYMAVSGGRTETLNCAVPAIKFSNDVVEALEEYSRQNNDTIEVRVGIHTGSVIGGVIGNLPAHYDYWGDTVNVASRIQQHAAPGSILVSETTYHRAYNAYNFTGPVVEPMKGVGDIKVYTYVSCRNDLDVPPVAQI